MEAKFSFDAIKNTEGTIQMGRIPITIPFAGDCMGEGTNSRTSPAQKPHRPGLLYVRIRRQLPLVGDYDFNDVVPLTETYFSSPRENMNGDQAHTVDVTPLLQQEQASCWA